MQTAIDCATDEKVAANFALRGRRYRCERCFAPVGLRDGAQNSVHFAHAIGKADPDCEDYFGGTYAFTGRRHQAGVNEKKTNGLDATELFFELAASGPMLSLWFPATNSGIKWMGHIDVTSASANRRLSYQHLENGHLVTFALADGQWNISADGEVSIDYLARLDLGPASLESGINLFDATRSPGKQLGPAVRIRLGESVWVITRNPEFQARVPSAKVTCERRALVGGWIVLLVELPRECDSDLIPQLRDWLQRPISLPRARVWIERPFPIRVTSHSSLVFSEDTKLIVLRTDQPVDLEIVETQTLRCMLHMRNTSYAEWKNVLPGCWTVRANGSDFLQFEICREHRDRPPVFAIMCDEKAVPNLFALQEHIVDLVSRNSRSATLRLQWSAPAVGELLRLNGEKIEVPSDVFSTEVTLVPGTEITAANLGVARWQATARSPARQVVSDKIIHRLRARARWLLSISCIRNATSELITRVPNSLSNDDVFRRLITAAWEPKFSPHVRALTKELEEFP